VDNISIHDSGLQKEGTVALWPVPWPIVWSQASWVPATTRHADPGVHWTDRQTIHPIYKEFL